MLIFIKKKRMPLVYVRNLVFPSSSFNVNNLQKIAMLLVPLFRTKKKNDASRTPN